MMTLHFLLQGVKLSLTEEENPRMKSNGLKQGPGLLKGSGNMAEGLCRDLNVLETVAVNHVLLKKAAHYNREAKSAAAGYSCRTC